MTAWRWSISRRCLRVWQRNFAVYRKTWKISFLPPLLEPVLYLFAFGVGLSAMVKGVSYRGEAVSYIAYIAPALLAVAIMYNAFFETTYNSFVRMYYQKTFDAMLATPMNLAEIITGEILWAATKSVIALTLMQMVVSLFGLISYPEGLLLVLVAILGGLAFASIGMFFTGVVPTIEVFNLPIFLFITPMFLFSGTFFPLQNLPGWAQVVAHGLPLTHLVGLTRALTMGYLGVDLLWHIAYLLLFAAVFFPLALHKMHKRLIK